LNSTQSSSTPLPVIAAVSRLVTRVTDRITGDRSEFPLLVATVTTEALRHCGIEANVFYGEAAWIEVMENQSVMWVGCWGGNSHFWTVTPFGEIVDLNTSVSHRKKSRQNPDHQPKFSPPILWSKEVPVFYRYKPGGIAEVELDSERDRRWLELCLKEVVSKLGDLQSLLATPENALDFPEEPVLCPGRRILDDGAGTFRHFDRALAVHGVPDRPF
jgi:hypothetical protein